MAATSLSFGAQVDAWAQETEKRMTAVFVEASDDIIDLMNLPTDKGGLMPVKSGFLRSTLVKAINQDLPAMTLKNPDPNGSYSYVATMSLAGAKLGDTITAGYAANYAGHVHYGAQGRAPRPFVTWAAAQWEQVVKAANARVKAGAGA